MQHTVNGVAYVPMWQTWTVVRPSVNATHEQNNGVTVESKSFENSSSMFRERMQIARIKHRMTIDGLANVLKCDSETLASFERGDEVMPESLQHQIRKVLNIS
jgi:ribosome-binding protein aMBF1 (putative translation factor)